MNRESISWALTTVVLYFLISGDTGVAAEKCTGDYATHSCFGGNGKRSDPNAFGAEADPHPNSRLLEILSRGLQELRTRKSDGWRYPTQAKEDQQSVEALDALGNALVQEEQARQQYQQYANPDMEYETSYRYQREPSDVVSRVLSALRQKRGAKRMHRQD